MNRSERRAGGGPRPLLSNFRSDTSAVPMCAHCEPEVLLDVDAFSGQLTRTTLHDEDCPEYAVLLRRLQRKEARRG